MRGRHGRLGPLAAWWEWIKIMAGTPSPPEPYNVVQAATEGWTDPYTLKPEDEGRTIRFSVDPSVNPDDTVLYTGPSWNDYDPEHVQRLNKLRTDEDGEVVEDEPVCPPSCGIGNTPYGLHYRECPWYSYTPPEGFITNSAPLAYDPFVPGTEMPKGLIEGVGINLRYFRHLLAKQHAGDWLSHHEVELLKSRPELTISAIDRQLKALEDRS